MLNKAHVIETTKACKVAFMKARGSFAFRYRKELAIWKRKQDDENLFLKASN